MSLQKSSSVMNISCNSKFRPNSPSSNILSVQDLKHREKLYLSIIVDLTNRNNELQNQVKSQLTQISELECQLRRGSHDKSKTENQKSLHQEPSAMHIKNFEIQGNHQGQMTLLKMHSEKALQYSTKNSSAQFTRGHVVVSEKNIHPKDQATKCNNNKQPIIRLPLTPFSNSQNAGPKRNKINESVIIQTGQLSAKNIQRRNIYVTGAVQSPSSNSPQKNGLNFKPLSFSNRYISKPTVNCPEDLKSPDKKLSGVNTPDTKYSGFYGLLTSRLKENQHKNRQQFQKEQSITCDSNRNIQIHDR